MKINLICNDFGWIYEKFIKMFEKYSQHNIVVNTFGDINHYIPYYMMKDIKAPSLNTVWASHQENKDPLRSLFISSSLKSNHVFCQAKKYMDLLKKNKISNISQIMPGVDFDILKPKKSLNQKMDKLQIGWVGRSYSSSNRKNTNLLNKIYKLDFVNLKITGGKIKEKEMGDFYNSCDLIIQTSLVEGGGMSITESLACGKPVMCYDGVGVANEFDFGVIKVPFNNESKFVSRLKDFWKNKEFENYCSCSNMEKMVASVSHLSWKNFVNHHDNIWKAL